MTILCMFVYLIQSTGNEVVEITKYTIKFLRNISWSCTLHFKKTNFVFMQSDCHICIVHSKILNKKGFLYVSIQIKNT